jgi:hypothetical protein
VVVRSNSEMGWECDPSSFLLIPRARNFRCFERTFHRDSYKLCSLLGPPPVDSQVEEHYCVEANLKKGKKMLSWNSTFQQKYIKKSENLGRKGFKFHD